jgi:hypothetical protein
MTMDEAKLTYVHLVSSLCPRWHHLMTEHDGFDSDNDDVTDDMLVYDADADRKRHERAAAARAEAVAAQQAALRARVAQGAAAEEPLAPSPSGSASSGPMGPVFSSGAGAVHEADLALLSRCADAVRELSSGTEAGAVTRVPVGDDLGAVCSLDDPALVADALGARMAAGTVLEDEYGSSLLHHAADQAAERVCRWLLQEHSYPVGLRDGSGGTALLNAVAAGSVACVAALVAAGARVDRSDASEVESAEESLGELPAAAAAEIRALLDMPAE